jgi:DNA invertase Pin-like site-specific DNA recombinase
VLRGGKHGRAKITEEQARDVLRRIASGETHRSIAKLYGVGRTTVTAIARGNNWAHLLR